MNPADPNDPSNWVGGGYCLSIELGPRDESRLRAASVALRESASIRVIDRMSEPGQIYGIVRLPTGSEVVCRVISVLEGYENEGLDEADKYYDGGSDWLTLYLPTGALQKVDPHAGGYSFTSESGRSGHTLRLALDAWLVGVALHVYERVCFPLGLVGFEVGGEVHAATLAGEVPSQRDFGFLVPLDDVLRYYPATF